MTITFIVAKEWGNLDYTGLVFLKESKDNGVNFRFQEGLLYSKVSMNSQ